MLTTVELIATIFVDMSLFAYMLNYS